MKGATDDGFVMSAIQSFFSEDSFFLRLLGTPLRFDLVVYSVYSNRYIIL